MQLNTASESAVADPTDAGTLRPSLRPTQKIRTNYQPLPTKAFPSKINLPVYNSSYNTIDPYAIWSLFFNNEAISYICTATNAYASSKSRYKKWRPVDEYDILAYLAIWIYMGVYPNPDIMEYWSINPDNPQHL